MVDGDAPPERFDHVYKLIREEVRRYTKPNFLTMNGLDPCRNRGQITVVVGLALTGFRVRLATRRRHDGPKRTRYRSSRRRFLETHKFTAASRFFGSRLLERDSPRFGCPAHFLLPGGCPELASLFLLDNPHGVFTDRATPLRKFSEFTKEAPIRGTGNLKK